LVEAVLQLRWPFFVVLVLVEVLVPAAAEAAATALSGAVSAALSAASLLSGRRPEEQVGSMVVTVIAIVIELEE
jgi:hypothetical protein